MVHGASQWFWDPAIWLPPNVTWESFNSQQVVKEMLVEGTVVREAVIEPGDFARFGDLWYPIPLAVLVMLLRHFVEKYFFKPLGVRLGLKDSVRRGPAGNPVLEKAFRRGSWEVDTLAREAAMTRIQVERWLRQRRVQQLPNTLKKFQETGWRWLFYTFILLYGFHCLWSKPWFWNIRHCWYDYPYHQIDPDVWIYYMVELSFYWSLSISQFFDVKRKDFWEMFVHHNTTIALLMFSWTTHSHRIGTLVLIVHDCADHLLELAKMFRYTRYQKTCDAVFVLFAITWVVTRCGVYPTWILYSTLIDAENFVKMFPAYYIFNGLLGTLQLLHILWTYFLFKAIHKALSKGGVDDKRSDSELSEEEEDENENELKKDI